MNLLNELKQTITDLGGCKAAGILARIGASMCNEWITPPSFLTISASLDDDNMALAKRCLSITTEHDYSNRDQGEFQKWLEDQGWPVSKWKVDEL